MKCGANMNTILLKQKYISIKNTKVFDLKPNAYGLGA